MPHPPTRVGGVDYLMMFGPEHFRAYVFLSSAEGYERLETRTGGSIWTRDTVPEMDHRTRLDYLNADVGWRVGWNVSANDAYVSSYIKKTTDGGAGWSTQWWQEKPRPTGLLAVEFLDERYGFAGGIGAEFMYTADGGGTWRHYDSLYRADIRTRGDFATVLSIAAVNSTTALLGLNTTRLVRYHAAPASVAWNGAARSGFRVYPNPAHQSVHVDAERPMSGGIRLVNMLGQTVRSVAIAERSTTITIDLDGLPAGIYSVVPEGPAPAIGLFVKQ